jgi:hypothetical protein
MTLASTLASANLDHSIGQPWPWYRHKPTSTMALADISQLDTIEYGLLWYIKFAFNVKPFHHFLDLFLPYARFQSALAFVLSFFQTNQYSKVTKFSTCLCAGSWAQE